MDEQEDRFTVAVADLRLIWSRTTGSLSSLSLRDREWLVRGPELQVWRGATDNDGIKCWTNQNNKPLGCWLTAGLHEMKLEPEGLSVRRLKDGSVRIDGCTLGITRGGDIKHRYSFDVRPDGEIQVRNRFHCAKSLPDLPRLGVSFVLVPGLETIRWFGRGPHESYTDRKCGVPVGRYAGTVQGQYVPYIVPQEHGNKTDVRWMALEDPEEKVQILFGREDRLLECSASHYSAEDLFLAGHTTDLVSRREVIVNLDYAQRGLGTGSCGPDTLERHKIKPSTCLFNYRMRVGKGPVIK